MRTTTKIDKIMAKIKRQKDLRKGGNGIEIREHRK